MEYRSIVLLLNDRDFDQDLNDFAQGRKVKFIRFENMVRVVIEIEDPEDEYLDEGWG